jgi:hypothetical protein
MLPSSDTTEDAVKSHVIGRNIACVAAMSGDELADAVCR